MSRGFGWLAARAFTAKDTKVQEGFLAAFVALTAGVGFLAPSPRSARLRTLGMTTVMYALTAVSRECLFLISLSLGLEDLAAFHYERDGFQRLDVVQRISCGGDYVGVGAWGYRSDFAFLI